MKNKIVTTDYDNFIITIRTTTCDEPYIKLYEVVST